MAEKSFKIGDRVKVIKNPLNHSEKSYGNLEDGRYAGQTGTVRKDQGSADIVYVRFDSGAEYQLWNHNLVLTKEKQKPPKPPKFIVTWDERSGDPHKFFETLSQAKRFIKELSEKSELVADSIKLIEIKSLKKVTVKKSVRMELVK